MRFARIRGVGMVFLMAMASSGCASRDWMTTKSTTGTSPGLHLGSETGGTETTAPLPSDGYGNLPTQAGATSASSGGVVLASLRQAGSSIGNALKIQPKVTAAVDPVKLDNQPADQPKVAADLHYHAGYFFETQNKFREAAGHYRDALKNAPQDPRVLAGYGRTQDQLGNPLEAEQYLAKACELAPQEPSYCCDLAECHARRQKWDAALVHARRAVQLQPTNSKYWTGLATILVDSGRGDEAVRELTAAFGEADAQYQVATILASRKNVAQARIHLARALELNPRLEPARQLWNQFQPAANSTASANFTNPPRRLPAQ